MTNESMETKESKELTTIVEVMDDGPLKIKGDIFLKDLKNDISESVTELNLCRCGHSGKMPYCDDSHKTK
jgi:hypothetical protein